MLVVDVLHRLGYHANPELKRCMFLLRKRVMALLGICFAARNLLSAGDPLKEPLGRTGGRRNGGWFSWDVC
jgi:hypothetical protein